MMVSWDEYFALQIVTLPAAHFDGRQACHILDHHQFADRWRT
jgi:hypothetical protein